jgi:hypothetical protein
MSVATLDASVRIWLGRKGFGSDEVIRNLEDLAGTLTYGLIMLLQCLSKNLEKRRDEGIAKEKEEHTMIYRTTDSVTSEERAFIKKHCNEVIAENK